MATNPIPAGTKNLSVNLPESLHADLKRLASESGMGLSQYVRHILALARDQKLKVRSSYVAEVGEPLKAAEDPPNR